MRDGRLGPANYHNNHCDLVLSAIGFEHAATEPGLDLDVDCSRVEARGRRLEADSDGGERGGSEREDEAAVSGRRAAPTLCCFRYGPTPTIARGFSRL